MRKKQILLVDDDADDRDLFKEALYEIDDTIDCYTVNGGQAAIDFYEAQVPDIVFLDLNMPVINGKECLENLRRISDQPIIVMFSSTRVPRELAECTMLGADFFLLKPTSFSMMKVSLEAILYRRDDEEIDELVYPLRALQLSVK
jgi:CheY-like chemotaxis protein